MIKKVKKTNMLFYTAFGKQSLYYTVRESVLSSVQFSENFLNKAGPLYAATWNKTRKIFYTYDNESLSLLI